MVITQVACICVSISGMCAQLTNQSKSTGSEQTQKMEDATNKGEREASKKGLDPDEVVKKIRMGMRVNDFQRELPNVRLIAPWPGSGTVGFELDVRGGRFLFVASLARGVGLTGVWGEYKKKGVKYRVSNTKTGGIKQYYFDKKREQWLPAKILSADRHVPKSDYSPSGRKVKPPEGSGRAGRD